MLIMEKEAEDIQEVHLMPMDDNIEHIYSENCVCDPFLEPENEWQIHEGTATRIIWIHRHIRSELQ